MLRSRSALVDALMRARLVEVRHILLEHSTEMGLAHDHDVIEALAAHAPQQAFAERIRAWCLDRRSEHLDPCSHCNGIEVRPVFRIIITNQILRPLAVGRRFPQLLRDPRVTWRARHPDVHDPPRAELRDDEGEQRAKEEFMDLHEVTRPDSFGVVPEEGCPGLLGGPWWTGLPHVALYGSLGNLDADLEQFATDSLGTPETVVARHLLDQRNRLGWDLGLALRRVRLLLPEQTKTGAMPAEERVRFDAEQRLFPTPHPTREQHQERPLHGG